MVDVGDKPVTSREALASGEITMSADALSLIRSGRVAKGDPLQTARLAGIMAAKQTSSLIPLCHPLQLTHVSVELTPTRRGYRIDARVRTDGKTGVEMEALTAVSVAALTSAISMIEAVVAYLNEKHGISRGRAAIGSVLPARRRPSPPATAGPRCRRA